MKLDDPQPKKDVIYIDIEDDITSIIGKLKQAATPIVALVPPKRIGALQSIVNLKLLSRAADTAKKRVVLITSDKGLTALAAGVALPVAKNLQSKPEIATMPEDDADADDVIHGDVLPETDESVADEATSDGDDMIVAAPAAALAPEQKSRAKRGSVVPNFNAFRNKFMLILGGLVLLVGFLVWALVFAPHATITVTAKTTPYGVNKSLQATAGGQLDAAAGTLNAVVKEVKKSATVEFTATGKKDVGEKATGTVKFVKSTPGEATIAAGTTLTTSGGLAFVTTAAITVPGAQLSFSCTGYLCPGTVSGAVAAAEAGSKYNTASGSLTGAPSGVSASFSEAASGGTDKTVTVVSEQDAAAAREKLQAQDANSVKAELKKQFAADLIVVEESFVVTPGSPQVSPAVDQEASTAKITAETTYSMIGLARSDVRVILEKDLTKQLAGLPNQSIYDTGIDAVRFSTYSQEGKTYKATLQATGAVGPSIDSAVLAKRLVGKREGEIIADIKTYEGIHGVAVKFTPFWVSSAPSADKITIIFQLDNAKR